MRVFLDASVFIWALERPESNSARIVRMVNAGQLDAVVDDVVLAEVSRHVRATLGRSEAWIFAEQIRRGATVVPRHDCEGVLASVPEKLKLADRLHLAATRASDAALLVAFDADFQVVPEYVTPREFVRRIRQPTAPTEW